MYGRDLFKKVQLVKKTEGGHLGNGPAASWRDTRKDTWQPPKHLFVPTFRAPVQWRRAGTTLGWADFVCLLSPSPKPWKHSPQNLIPTQIPIPSFKEAFLDPRSCSLCPSPVQTSHACSPYTIWLPVDSSWIPLSHAQHMVGPQYMVAESMQEQGQESHMRKFCPLCLMARLQTV